MSNSDTFGKVASDGWIPGPNIGLSSEQTQDLYRQAQERIAAENKATEKAKARKAAEKGKSPDRGNNNGYDNQQQQQQAGGFFIRGHGFRDCMEFG